MKKSILTWSMLIIGALSLNAQKLSIESVQKIALRNSDAIKDGSEVKGYYFFYVSDKIDKKTNEYTLQITDNKLKKLRDIKFQDSKSLSILESSFNGADLLFLYHNDDERTFEYQVYGADGKKKFSYTRELTKKEERYLESTYLASDEDQAYKGLYPLEGKGFISNTPSRENKDYTFQIDYFSTEKKKQWSYTPTVGGKMFLGDYLGYYNGVVFIQVLRFGGALDQNPDSYLVGLDIETGKQMFEKKTDGKYRFYPASMSFVKGGKPYIFGQYFDLDDNMMKDKSNGFAFWSIDEKANIIAEKYVSWEADMGKYLDVNSKGKIDDFGFMFLHNMLQTSDGKIYAIGEGYKKVASGLGIASKVLTGGRGGLSAAKVKVTDMVFLSFDSSLNIKGAKIYDKNSNSVELPSGYEVANTTLLGRYIKYYFGGFDYEYTQVNKDKTSFTVCYSDYVKGKDYKGGTFNSITCNEGKFTTDRINTNSDASSTSVLPGAQGQVLVMEYYKKDKRLDAHFEKLN